MYIFLSRYFPTLAETRSEIDAWRSGTSTVPLRRDEIKEMSASTYETRGKCWNK